MSVVAGFITDYQRNLEYNQFFNGVPYTPPKQFFMGLSRNPAAREILPDEIVVPDYSRVLIPPNSFPEAVYGMTHLMADIVFPQPKTDWGVPKSLLFCDSEVGGNILMILGLTKYILVYAGGPPPTFLKGSIAMYRS